MFSVKLISNVITQAIQKNVICTNKYPINNWFIKLRHYTGPKEILSPLEYRSITKDRSNTIPVETSIKYLKSEAYTLTYGKDPVWTQYRRNHKGALPPRKTRRTCIRKNIIATGNPCPICRDEYLVLNENNTELLKQFISPHTGAVLSYQVTGLCQKRHQELLIALQRARDCGLITFDVPFRKYNYSDYYKQQ